jgi:hypothetical protein
MHHVRGAIDVAKVAQGMIDELRQVGPQRLLAQVAMGPAGKSDDPGSVSELLQVLGVLDIKFDAQVLSRQEVYAGNTGVASEGAGEVNHVSNLTAGVGVAPELRVVTSNETVDADQGYVQAVLLGHCWAFHSSRRRW